MFLLLHESGSRDPILVNTAFISSIGQGEFKSADCSWVRIHGEKAQAVVESVYDIELLLNPPPEVAKELGKSSQDDNDIPF